MAYYDYPLQAVMEKWIAEGGEPWQLIEPGDGFHPAQVGTHILTHICKERGRDTQTRGSGGDGERFC